ncbi:MAG: long-chain acyl-CoA synthetase [Actinomycetota bacterium]|nr:long-chain acyl-CoA synthetase [Actinomycetota bacterium]
MTDREALNAAADRGLLAAYWAERKPDEIALRSAVGDRTFAEVDANANRLVRALRARGVQTGDGVAVLCSNRPEFLEAVVAVRRAGLRLTTINWHLTGDEAGYIVDDCDATAFVADARFAEAAAGAAKRAPDLKARISVGGEIDGFEPWDAALSEHAGDALEDPSPGRTMLYTSGTTGRPKGVHRPGDPRGDLDVGLLTQYDPDRHVHLCTGPLYHAAPLAFSFSAPAALGVPIVLMDGWSAEETLALIEEHGITHTHMVPTMFHRLLSLPDEVKRQYDISSLIFILHGAAPCPVEVKWRLMEWLGPIVWEYYAATEGSGTLVSPQQWLRRPGTVGKVEPPDHVRILDADRAEAAPGEIGTVYLKAPTPAAGRFQYYKSPEKTAGAYSDSGDYFTLGDYGYVDADGYLFLTDRSAHLIISGGVNIYPAEIEAELIGHPAVGDVGVVGVPDDDWGEIVVAVVEPQPGVAPSPELAAELVEWCRGRIAHYKCPRRVEFTEALPRHDNGKLYKHQLREQLRNQ